MHYFMYNFLTAGVINYKQTRAKV